MTWTGDEFRGTGSIDPKWLTYYATGAETASVLNGQLVFADAKQTNFTPRVRYQQYAAPFKISARLTYLSKGFTPTDGSTAGADVGLILLNSETGRSLTFSFCIYAGITDPGVSRIRVLELNEDGTISTDSARVECRDLQGFLQLEDDGVNFYMRFARLGARNDAGDAGLQWDTIYQQARTFWLGAPDAMGFFVNGQGAAVTGLFDWMRVGDGAAPPDPSPPPFEIFVPGPLDHVATGKERLLQQFKGGAHPNIQALVAAPLVHSNRLEGVIWTLITQCYLSNAQGHWLDEWGALLGFERGGWTDTVYRAYLQVWLLALRSCGTWPEIVNILLTLNGSATFTTDDLPYDPAGFKVSWTDPPLDSESAALWAKFLGQARAAGVKCWFYSWPAAGSTLFTFSSNATTPETDASLGFDGGGFAREVNP